MKSITISIVTCTFNSEKYLKNALKSIESQTYQPIEHIINDAYSTDSTLEIIQEYIERNKNRYRIKFIQSESKGVGNALNVATKEATGGITHYLHSDDYYLNRGSLEKVAGIFKNSLDLVWLTGNFLIELAGRKVVIPLTHLLRMNPETALSFMNFISHENTWLYRFFWENLGEVILHAESLAKIGTLTPKPVEITLSKSVSPNLPAKNGRAKYFYETRFCSEVWRF